MGSGVKESTSPLFYIFNKAKHAGNYSPFNYHISFVDLLLLQNLPFDFAHSSCIFGNIKCNIGEMRDLYAVFPLFSSNVLGEDLQAWDLLTSLGSSVNDTVTCFNAWRKRRYL